MATQKKAATRKGIKVRDLKPSKDAKGGFARSLNVRSADSRSADTRSAEGRTLSSPKQLN